MPTACLDAIPAGASVEIYTDGACLGNSGPAACAYAIVHGGKVIHSAARYLGHATNNIAELTAALDGLRCLADRSAGLRVTLLSDSNQVIQGMSAWLANWKARGWRRADGKPVTNRQHYEELDAIASAFPSLHWQHVKGHAGNEFNELVDKLANGKAAAGSAAGA